MVSCSITVYRDHRNLKLDALKPRMKALKRFTCKEKHAYGGSPRMVILQSAAICGPRFGDSTRQDISIASDSNDNISFLLLF